MRKQTAAKPQPLPSVGYEVAGRVAGADEGFAAKDLKGANKNAKAVTGAAKHELSQMDKDITKHYKELYHFALAALEKSLPGDPSDTKPQDGDQPSHRKQKKHKKTERRGTGRPCWEVRFRHVGKAPRPNAPIFRGD